MNKTKSMMHGSVTGLSRLCALIALLGGGLLSFSSFAAEECGNPAANGSAPDAFSCSGTISSINYPATQGNLTLTLTNGVAIPGGIAVQGSGADAVIINRSDAVAGSGDPQIGGAAGVGLQATTGTGALTVTLTDADTGDAPVSISGTNAGAQLQSGGTAGAALNLTFTNGSIAATGANGVGIQASTTSTGAGNLVLNIGGSVSGATGIQAGTSGTGTLSVNLTAASATVAGGDVVGTNGPAIRLSPNANATVQVNAGRTVRASNGDGGVIDITNVNATRTVSIQNNDRGTIRSSDESIAGYGDVAIRVAGGAGNSSILNNGAGSLLRGRLILQNTGNVTISSAGSWQTIGANVLGAGASAAQLTLMTRGQLVTNVNGIATSLVFGDGADTFNNTGGQLRVGGGQEGAATLTISGLETWINSGRIIFGVSEELQGEVSDGVGNDRITIAGAPTLFTGATSGSNSSFRASTFIMDADLGASQADCLAAISADCLDLRGGSTAGVTAIRLNTVGIGPGAERIVLVDVSGSGTSGEGHFILDADTPGLRNIGGTGGVVDGGFLLYGLSYDAEAKQHVLVPQMIDSEALEIGLFGRAARTAWETATGSWMTRQADQRTVAPRQDEGAGTGIWMKYARNSTKDTVIQRYPFGPDSLDFDNGYSQSTSALVGGADLINVSKAKSAWVVGITGAYLSSKLAFHESPTELDLDGESYGIYTSFYTDKFFVDAILNWTQLDSEYSAPSAEIVGIKGKVDSHGYQFESGYRLSSSDGTARLEPLIALSYVKSDLTDLAFANIGVQMDEASSFRGAVGARFAGELETDSITTQLAFTGRIWREFDGENKALVKTPGQSYALVDDGSDTFGDVAATLGILVGNRLSAVLNCGVLFKQDYQSTSASMSVRYEW